MNQAIKLNDSIAPRSCPLCGLVTNPNIQPELTLAGSMRVVCRNCGRYHAPALVALLELAWAGGRPKLIRSNHFSIFFNKRRA